MRLSELIKELKKFQEKKNRDPIVTFSENAIMDGTIYLKEHSDLYLANLKVEDTPIGKYVRGLKSDEGDYLVIDLVDSKFFTPDDFQK